MNNNPSTTAVKSTGLELFQRKPQTSSRPIENKVTSQNSSQPTTPARAYA